MEWNKKQIKLLLSLYNWNVKWPKENVCGQKSPVEIVLRYVIKINNKKKLRTG